MSKYYYAKEFPIDSSIEDRRKKCVGDIYINSVKCLRCDQVIVSMNRHDYVECSCGNVAADGGSWYLKRNYKTEQWEELSIPYNNVQVTQ